MPGSRDNDASASAICRCDTCFIISSLGILTPAGGSASGSPMQPSQCVIIFDNIWYIPGAIPACCAVFEMSNLLEADAHQSPDLLMLGLPVVCRVDAP